MLQAESGLNPYAERYGVWPDVSFGYSQIIVATAAGYGVGDGSNTQANIAAVREALFDRATSIDLGARHLAGCWARAEGYEPHDLQALVAYNSGRPRLPDDPYWTEWAGNVRAYQSALEWARGVIG